MSRMRAIAICVVCVGASVVSTAGDPTLWINGRRVDDETVVLPRPHQAGGKMHRSLRVPLKSFLKPGKNVLGMYVMRYGYVRDAYLRGSVVMEFGDLFRRRRSTNFLE